MINNFGNIAEDKTVSQYGEQQRDGAEQFRQLGDADGDVQGERAGSGGRAIRRRR